MLARPPDTRYVTSAGLGIAYQVVEGRADGIDVLYVAPRLSQIEHLWEHPPVERALRRLAALGRLILFDRRGIGLSDATNTPFTVADEVADVVVVLDAAGSSSAAVVSQLTGGALACLLAATHPDRVAALALHACFARTTWAPNYAWAPTARQRDVKTDEHGAQWGSGVRTAGWAPSWADDPRAQRWLARMETRVGSPPLMARQNRLLNTVDVRPALPAISAPTLVTRRHDDAFIDARHSAYLAERIPGAVLQELDGQDAFAFAGDADAWVDAVGRFVAGHPPPSAARRMMVSILFTDIVGSTEMLTRIGDDRWSTLVAEHNRIARQEVGRFGGQLFRHTGDGVLAGFEAPADALRCGRACIAAMADVGLPVRAGVHAGSCDLVDGDLAGRTVHEAARIAALASGGELLTSSAVEGLLAGSELRFDPRGARTLRGLSGEYELFAVATG